MPEKPEMDEKSGKPAAEDPASEKTSAVRKNTTAKTPEHRSQPKISSTHAMFRLGRKIARLCFVLLKNKAEFDPTYAPALAK